MTVLYCIVYTVVRTKAVASDRGAVDDCGNEHVVVRALSTRGRRRSVVSDRA